MGDIKLSGTEAFISELEGLLPTTAELNAALTASAAPIYERMLQLAPVGKTRKLKDAIKIANPKAGKQGRMVTIGVHQKDFGGDPKEFYPAFVEYGHGGPHPARANPYIRPAYEAGKDEAYQILKDKLAKR